MREGHVEERKSNVAEVNRSRTAESSAPPLVTNAWRTFAQRTYPEGVQDMGWGEGVPEAGIEIKGVDTLNERLTNSSEIHGDRRIHCFVVLLPLLIRIRRHRSPGGM